MQRCGEPLVQVLFVWMHSAAVLLLALCFCVQSVVAAAVVVVVAAVVVVACRGTQRWLTWLLQASLSVAGSTQRRSLRCLDSTSYQSLTVKLHQLGISAVDEAGAMCISFSVVHDKTM